MKQQKKFDIKAIMKLAAGNKFEWKTGDLKIDNVKPDNEATAEKQKE